MKRQPPKPPMGYDLAGWPWILPLLGFSENVARRLMLRADDPLPVQPWFGKVVARKAELVAWAERERAREGATVRGRAAT